MGRKENDETTIYPVAGVVYGTGSTGMGGGIGQRLHRVRRGRGQ